MQKLYIFVYILLRNLMENMGELFTAQNIFTSMGIFRKQIRIVGITKHVIIKTR